MRTITTCALVALSLTAAAPAVAFSLLELEPGERDAMLATCRLLPGADASMCRDVVNDGGMSANDKRSCLHAMKAMLQGSAWAQVRSMPAAMTCRAGLARGGYPVNTIAQRLTGTSTATR